MQPQCAPPSVIQNSLTTVARHFGRNQHTRDDLKVQILELISLNPLGPHADAYRETREHFWIHRLRTLQLLGLNANDEKKYKWKRGNPVATATTSNQSGAAGGHSSQS